jgi:hypothetical protein
MRNMGTGGLALALALSAMSIPRTVISQPPSERVAFVRSAGSATRSGTLGAGESTERDYVVSIRAGQILKVELTAEHPGIFFEVFAPGRDTPLVNSASSGQPHWSATLPAEGNYTVRVQLRRAAAQASDGVPYSITLSVAFP